MNSVSIKKSVLLNWPKVAVVLYNLNQMLGYDKTQTISNNGTINGEYQIDDNSYYYKK